MLMEKSTHSWFDLFTLNLISDVQEILIDIVVDLEWDFDHVTPGPQNPDLFDVITRGCTKPKPRNLCHIFTFSAPSFNIQGYVKNAVDNSVNP